MLYVKTKLKESPINGIGCFADEDIPKGTLIWKFTKGYDQEFNSNILEKLHDPDANFWEQQPSKQQFLKYAYISRATGHYILCSDDARFFNHSDDNNVFNVIDENEQEGIDYAARNIKAGEELTYDYNVFADFHKF